ncbi:MAG: PAS domain S-box protein [Desulfobacteraceae bacterium]|nr:PAS domain S-box protein [Desulfobacteraceae bacterium]
MAEKPTYEELERRVQEMKKNESEYKSSMEALRNSEVPYLLLFEHANVGIFVAQDGYLKVPNPYLSKMLGYSQAELEEQPLKLFIHPKFQSLVTTRHQERLSGKTGLPQTYDFRVISKNGKSIWVQLSTVLIQFKGRPATLNFLHDITERKQAEELLRSTFDFSPIGKALVAPEGPFLNVNASFCRILGYSKEELLTKIFQDIIWPDDLEAVLANNIQLLVGEIDTYEMEIGGFHKDESLVWAQINVSLVRNSDSKFFIAQIQDITERKRIEKALRESEESYRRLADNSPDMIYRMSLPEGRYEYVSPASTNIFGYPPQIWYDNPLLVSETLHPDYLSYFEKQWKNLLKGDLPASYEYKIIHKDGSVRWVNQRNILVTNEDNRPLAIEGLLTDITERKQAEEQLQKSEERFRNLYDDAPVGYFEYDLRGNITRVNHTHSKLLGYTAEEMIGQPCWKFIVNEVAREQILDKLRGARPPAVGLERTYRRKDGTTFSVLFQDRLLLDEEGRITGIRTAIQDITERKRAEEALKENEQKFRTIFNSNMDSISLVGIGPDGKPTGFIDCNNAASDIFGYTREELMLKKLEDLEIQVPESVMIQRLEALQTKGSVDFETVIKDKNGNDRYVEVKAVLMSLADQLVIMNISRDITERKQAEARILYLKKSESLGRMAGAVAHHFNNILMITIGHLELVQEDIQQGSVIADNIKEAALAAHRAVALSQLMLTYLGQGVRKNETIDLSELCRVKMKDLSKAMPENISLTTQFEFTGLMLHSDRSHLEQVLKILFENAVEALMEETSGKISVTLEPVETSDIQYVHMFPNNWHAGPEEYARLVFSDTGKGMAEETIHQIFEPFYSDKFTGRGLGLAVALGIVKAHGGCICVQSKAGQGTDFIIILPLSTMTETGSTRNSS